MATPYIQPINSNLTFVDNGPLRLAGTVKDASGAAIDVSVGWTLYLQVSANPSVAVPSHTDTLNADGTFVCSLNSTGDTGSIPFGTRQFELLASNDSGASKNVLMYGTINRLAGSALSTS